MSLFIYFALPAALAELFYMSHISLLRSSTVTNMTNNQCTLNFVFYVLFYGSQ